MFVSIILQTYEDFHDRLNPIPIFLENVNKFKRAWAQYCEDKSSCELHKTKIINFLRYLKPPLGMNKIFCFLFLFSGVKKNDKFLKIGKKILKMNISW